MTHVASYEIGPGNSLRLSVLLRMAQETSEQHLAALGIGYERLWKDGIVFLITTNRVRIKRMPLHDEEVVIKTHPRGSAGVQFYRDFKFYVNGELVVDMIQSSVCVDPATHKIHRPKVFLSNGIFQDVPADQNDRLEKLRLPQDMPFAGERPIRYSDLDQNMHLNNAIYGDILCDFMPGGMIGRSFSEVQINYVTEAVLGETLKIYTCEEKGEVLVRGDHEHGLGFSVRAVMLSQ